MAVSERIRSLDGLRGLAILLVLHQHLFNDRVPYGLPGLTGFVRRYTSGVGHLGVDLFFVLSGFLIAGILIDNRGASNYFRVFYARRAFRILPAYLLLLGVFCAGQAGFFDKWIASASEWMFQKDYPIWKAFSFLQNFHAIQTRRMGGEVLAPTWSLAIEEQFYLLFPLIVFLSPKRFLWVIFPALMAMAMQIKMRPDANVMRHFFPFARFDAFMAGALIALAVRDSAGRAVLSWFRRALPALLAILTLILVSFQSTGKHYEPATYATRWAWSAVMLMMCLGETGGAFKRGFENGALVMIGHLSYGLYLFHNFALGTVHGLFGVGVAFITPEAPLWMTGLGLALAFALAGTVHVMIEKPCIRLGSLARYRA